MNDAEIKMLLKNFLDAEEKLIAFPAKRKKKLYALIYLSGKLEAEHEYTEREINDVLSNVKKVAEKYGAMSIEAQENVFVLHVLLTISQHPEGISQQMD